MGAVINTWIKMAVKFHDILHGFLGMGTAIMEIKMYQYMYSIDQVPRFVLFLDPWNSYAILDRQHFL